MIEAHLLHPNTWNPNVMVPEMRDKERTSILTYGFIDPLTVRRVDNATFQIIDGENRYTIGSELGMDYFPCWVIDVDEDTAKELTPILNELRGHADERKLGALLADLMKRRDESQLRAVMPFSREQFDGLIGTKTIDWEAIGTRHTTQAPGERWVERVYRMPATVAEVVDEAIGKAKREGSVDNDWQGLELVCADYLGS